MKLTLQRQEYLTEQLSRDYKLLGQLEDEHRLSSDPQEKAKFKLRIETLEQEIQSRNLKLEGTQTNLISETYTEAAVIQEQRDTKILTVAESPYASLTEFQTQNFIIKGDFFESSHPIPIVDFVGRQETLKDIIEINKEAHFFVITGITGIGKTALLKQVINFINGDSILWHKFRVGFITLEDVLINLARFLDRKLQTNLFEKSLRTADNSIQDKINLIVKGLNGTQSYLFFDDFHLIEANLELESLFNLLKDQLKRGSIFASSVSQPNFITPQDIAEKKVRIICLEGLNKNEVKELLLKKGIQLSQEVIEKLDSYLDGMPLAIDLLLSLAGDKATEEELIKIAEEVQGKIIEYLYTALYKKLNDTEKDLLVIASLLKLPFKKDTLIQLNRKVFDKNASADFIVLKKDNLIVEIGNGYFKVPDILTSLVITHTNLKVKELSGQLADHLIEIATDNYSAHLETFLLYKMAENWDQAADVASELIDSDLSIYNPQLAERLLNKLDESKLDANRQLSLIGDKGLVAAHLRQFDKAENLYAEMLNLAKKLKNKYAESLALQRLGVIYVRKNDAIKAERFYIDSLGLKIELNDINGQAEIHNNLGLIYSDRGDYELARQEFERGLFLRTQEEHPTWQYLALYNSLGTLYGGQQNWEKANKYSKKALEIAEELQSPYDIARSIYNLGVHDSNQGNFEKAENNFLSAIEISEKHNVEEIEELGCIALGRLYFDNDKFLKGISYFEQVAKIFEAYGQKEQLCKINFDIGSGYASCGHTTEAINHYLKAFELFEHLVDKDSIKFYLQNTFTLVKQSEDVQEKFLVIDSLKKLRKRICDNTPSYKLSVLYDTIGKIYIEILSKERVGIACFRQEIKILEKLNLYQEAVKILMYVGSIYENSESYAKALKVLDEARKIIKSRNFAEMLGAILYNSANIYAKIKKYNSALRYYKKAEEFALRKNDFSLLNMVRHNLGETYRRQGNFEKAIELLEKTLVFARKQNIIYDIVFVLNNIGLAYEEKGDEITALTHWHEAVNLAHSNNLHHEETNTLISIGSFYWNKENFLQARNYYEQSLKVARENHNINMEEAAMISLADAHRRLGTASEIEKDFIKIAERADELGHYEHLCQFLAIAGAINLEEGEAEESAKMFEQSLVLVYWRILNFLTQFASHHNPPFDSLELPFVLSRMGWSIEVVIQNGAIELANKMYGSLKNRLRDRNLGDDNLIDNVLKDTIEVLIV